MRTFEEEARKEGIFLNQEMLKQFETFYLDLVKENEKFNLTRITTRDEVYALHFYDSLMVSKAMEEKDERRLLDIGSGAGFPGIPLKIAFPHLSVTMIEATNKKVDFINNEIKNLGLINVRTLHLRAEDFTEIASFDYVTCRAVGSLNDTLSYTLPFLRIGGSFIAMKSVLNGADEIKEAEKEIKHMGGKLSKVIPYQVLDRHYELVVIKKLGPSPKGYPHPLHRDKSHDGE